MTQKMTKIVHLQSSADQAQEPLVPTTVCPFPNLEQKGVQNSPLVGLILTVSTEYRGVGSQPRPVRNHVFWCNLVPQGMPTVASVGSSSIFLSSPVFLSTSQLKQFASQIQYLKSLIGKEHSCLIQNNLSVVHHVFFQSFIMSILTLAQQTCLFSRFTLLLMDTTALWILSIIGFLS